MLKEKALRYTYGDQFNSYPHNQKQLAHKGTTKLAPPIARPITLRPAIMPVTVVVQACHKAPKAKSTSAIKTTFLRPSLSANSPAAGLAMSANKLVDEVIRLLSSVDNGLERSLLIDTRVEEITPVLLEKPSVLGSLISRFR